MSSAFVDASVLVDALLKSGEQRARARKGLSRFDETLLPVYAIREFRCGALYYFAWLHNKLAAHRSFEEAINWLVRSGRESHKVRTALEVLRDGAGRMLKGVPLSKLVETYGEAADADRVIADRYRHSLRAKIDRAWRDRRVLATRVTNPLECFPERKPYRDRGAIKITPLTCTRGASCGIRGELAAAALPVGDVVRANSKLPASGEQRRRDAALRALGRRPDKWAHNQHCRGLGDAYYVLTCPDGAVILTTNTSHHAPLAAAIGKVTEEP